MTAAEIIRQTAAEYGITVQDMLARGRKKAFIRFDCMTRLRAVKRADGRHRFTMARIAQLLGYKDHTPVIHGLKRWAEHIEPKSK